MIARPPDFLLASTGFGMRTWLAAADSWGLRDALLAWMHRLTSLLGLRVPVVWIAGRCGDDCFVAVVARWFDAVVGVGGLSA